MKYLFLVSFFVLPIFYGYAQEYYDLSGLQGLRGKDGDVCFEISGYDIRTSVFSGKADDATIIDNLKAKFKIGTVLAEYADTELSYKNKIIEAEANIEYKSGEKQNQVLYVIAKNGDSIACIFFQTINQRDVALEQVFVDAYLADQLEEYIGDNGATAKITFIGREIHLQNDCKWIAPHNIKCGNAQLKWTEYSSYESALLDINNRIRLSNNNRVSIISEGEVDVLFENIPSVAHRIVYKEINVDTGQEDLIASYYVVQEVDGRYVSCVLSNPITYPNDYNLAYLLSQIMSIPQLPTDNNYMEQYEEGEEQDAESFDTRGELEIQAGSLLPIGGLSKAFKAAPSVGFLLGIPVSKKIFIDVGLQVSIPVSKSEFLYYRNKDSYRTEADIVGGFSLRVRYKKELSRNLYLNPYAGLGVNFLQTDLEKDSYDDESDRYESVVAPDMYLGFNVKYKKFGVFSEYHYIPYSIGNKVRGNFGNSTFNMGLVYSFVFN